MSSDLLAEAKQEIQGLNLHELLEEAPSLEIILPRVEESTENMHSPATVAIISLFSSPSQEGEEAMGNAYSSNVKVEEIEEENSCSEIGLKDLSDEEEGSNVQMVEEHIRYEAPSKITNPFACHLNIKVEREETTTVVHQVGTKSEPIEEIEEEFNSLPAERNDAVEELSDESEEPMEEDEEEQPSYYLQVFEAISYHAEKIKKDAIKKISNKIGKIERKCSQIQTKKAKMVTKLWAAFPNEEEVYEEVIQPYIRKTDEKIQKYQVKKIKLENEKNLIEAVLNPDTFMAI